LACPGLPSRLGLSSCTCGRPGGGTRDGTVSYLQMSHAELDDAPGRNYCCLSRPGSALSAPVPAGDEPLARQAPRQSARPPTYSDLLAAQPGEETCNRTITDI
jgi:hypothetical protein